jgi:hypothetical protein
LKLFPDLFQLLFDLHHVVRDRDLAALRTDRVRLAVHFLDEEIELAPGGVGEAQRLEEEFVVAVEADAFFGNVPLVREQRDLELEPLRVVR